MGLLDKVGAYLFQGVATPPTSVASARQPKPASGHPASLDGITSAYKADGTAGRPIGPASARLFGGTGDVGKQFEAFA